MKKIYLVKKDPSVSGDENNWITMNSYEFAMFIQTEEGQKRKKNFGQMNAVDVNDYILVIEGDEETAREMRIDVNHATQIRQVEKELGVKITSLNEKRQDSDRSKEEIYLADEVDTAEEAIRKIETEKLMVALDQLDEEQFELIYRLYLSDDRISEYKYAEEIGITRALVSWRKRKILALLRAYIENTEKG